MPSIKLDVATGILTKVQTISDYFQTPDIPMLMIDWLGLPLTHDPRDQSVRVWLKISRVCQKALIIGRISKPPEPRR